MSDNSGDETLLTRSASDGRSVARQSRYKPLFAAPLLRQSNRPALALGVRIAKRRATETLRTRSASDGRSVARQSRYKPLFAAPLLRQSNRPALALGVRIAKRRATETLRTRSASDGRSVARQSRYKPLFAAPLLRQSNRPALALGVRMAMRAARRKCDEPAGCTQRKGTGFHRCLSAIQLFSALPAKLVGLRDTTGIPLRIAAEVVSRTYLAAT